jgi:hypothetical protein
MDKERLIEVKIAYINVAVSLAGWGHARCNVLRMQAAITATLTAIFKISMPHTALFNALADSSQR